MIWRKAACRRDKFGQYQNVQVGEPLGVRRHDAFASATLVLAMVNEQLTAIDAVIEKGDRAVGGEQVKIILWRQSNFCNEETGF